MSTTVRHGFVRVGPSDGSKIPASKSGAAEVGRYELSENEKCEKYRPFYSNHLLIFSKNLFWCFCIFSISSLTRCWDLYQDSLALGQNKKTPANQRKQSHLPEYNQSSSTYQKSSIKNGHKVNHSKIWEIHVFSLRTRTPSRFSIRKVGSNF